MKCPGGNKIASLILLGFGYGLAWDPSAFAAEEFQTSHAKVRLISEFSTVQPGVPFSVGLAIQLKPGWHTYWLNPGDSGEPVRLRWETSGQFQAGALEFPVPKRIERDPLANFGYEGEPVFLSLIRPATTLTPGSTLDLKAEAKWLVCEEECIPEQATLRLSLPVTASTPTRHEPNAALFKTARTQIPQPWPFASPRLLSSAKDLILELPQSAFPRPEQIRWEFFPEQPGLIENFPKAELETEPALRLRLKKNPASSVQPSELAGVLTVREGDGARQAYFLEARLSASSWRPANFFWAFLGGLLLNLMPCVFPVLSLKILSFVKQGGKSSRRVRRHAYSYSAGILISFWILAGILLVLRQGGAQLGWGFQLQSPYFLIVLIFILFALSLSLFGFFHIGESWMGLGDSWTRRPGYAGSFFSGVLATVVATPCMAPLIGSSLGFALTQPALQALLIFTAMALGLAAPYLLFSFIPHALRLLPKPGSWMQAFSQLMGFFILAAVVWLAWVFALQTGIPALFQLIAALLLLVFGIWLVTRVFRSLHGPWGIFSRALLLLLFLIGGGALASRNLPDASSPDQELRSSADGLSWEKFSPERLAELRRDGKPVFINFTAAWCLTCQVNERVSFRSPEVRQAFTQKGVALLKADWTAQDPQIAKTLENYGRQGVPLYVLYGSNPQRAPRLLPEILTPSLLAEAVRNL